MGGKQSLTALMLCTIAVFFFVFLHHHAQKKLTPQPPIAEVIGMPEKINIPAINVNAMIEDVAIASDGSMDIPKVAMNAAWYKLGPKPGEIGSAVIDGHVDWINGATAVFADLNKLKIGDIVSIKDDRGKTITFLVRSTKLYEPTADDKDIFTSYDNKAHLNIITCSGVWDKTTLGFSQRLVVFTERQ